MTTFSAVLIVMMTYISPSILPTFEALNEEPVSASSAGTSLEGFLFEQSGISERYPGLSPECFEDPCVRPEGFVDETERIAALHSEILLRLRDEYDSEEFFDLMMADTNPANCSGEYEEYEMFVSCVVGEYRYRKSHKKTLPISAGG